MRIALVGPTHPLKGGVAAHTTQTAHRLAAAGHDVDLVSWSRLYPQRLYPGRLAVPAGSTDAAPYERTTHPLRWDAPASWWRTGRSLHGYALMAVVVVVPAQVPALLAIVRAARTGRPALAGSHPDEGGAHTVLAAPQVVAIVHNVVPHEAHPGAQWLMQRLLASADATLVHSIDQARLARQHGAARVAVAELPPHLPGGVPSPAARAAAVSARLARAERREVVRLLALGIVRDYKGLDLLLEAARGVPGVRLTIAGELWGDAGERVSALAAEPDLCERVRMIAGYVPAEQVPALMAEHDVLALPYRQATASQNVTLAFAHGMPVLATRVGTFGAQVRDGLDGLLAEAGDVAALAGSLARLVQPGALARLVTGVPQIDVDRPWTRYVEALCGLVR